METLCKSVKRHEGYSEEIQRDSRGNPSGGYGHKCSVGTKLPQHIWELILKWDLANASNDYLRIPRDMRCHLNTVRARVVTEMIFNMGLHGVLGFKKMWEAIREDNFEKAASEMLDSKWAFQVKSRATELASIFRNGGINNEKA